MWQCHSRSRALVGTCSSFVRTRAGWTLRAIEPRFRHAPAGTLEDQEEELFTGGLSILRFLWNLVVSHNSLGRLWLWWPRLPTQDPTHGQVLPSRQCPPTVPSTVFLWACTEGALGSPSSCSYGDSSPGVRGPACDPSNLSYLQMQSRGDGTST